MTEWSLEPDKDLTILIPARAGSKRVPGKNTRLLGGKPLIQWTIDAAREANVARIVISTDENIVKAIALNEWIEFVTRKPEHATDDASDILWVRDLLPLIRTKYFAICRPTSPFRTASTIRRGFAALVASKAHSIRAVERVIHPHPAKMWTVQGKYMRPVMSGITVDATPFHSLPTQSLPAVYKQTSSLEIAQTWVIGHTDTISGTLIAPFFTDELESISIDTEDDFEYAEAMVELARKRGGRGDQDNHVIRTDAVAHGAGEGGTRHNPAPGCDREGRKGDRPRAGQGDDPCGIYTARDGDGEHSDPQRPGEGGTCLGWGEGVWPPGA